MGNNETQIKMCGKFDAKHHKALVINCMKNTRA